jgi:putative acetyltransferase
MSVTIVPESPDTIDARSLIEELEEHLAASYPAESRHGYSVDKLLAQGVAFFVARVDGTPAACGGVQLNGAEYGELKRMYVRPLYRGRGLGTQLLELLAAHARSRGVGLLRLETGVHQKAAIALYARWGFRSIPPFGDYRPDPLSRFYERSIL